MHPIVQFCCSALLLLPVFAHAQGHRYLGSVIYPEKLHEDLEEFRSLVHYAHPDPYRYHDKQYLDLVFDSVKASIVVPLYADGFMTQMVPVLKAIGDSRCRVELPAKLQEELDERVARLPLTVRVIGDELFVNEELKGFRSFPTGARILKINGMDAAEIIDQLETVLVSSGVNRTYVLRTLEHDFPTLFYLHIDRGLAFEIDYTSGNEVPEHTTVYAMSAQDMANTRKPKGTLRLPWGSHWIPEISTMWLELSTMDINSLHLAGQQPEKFMAGLTRELEKYQGATLVIDLRGAGGSELGVAEQLFGSIAKEPYHLLKSISARAVDVPVELNIVAARSDIEHDVRSLYTNPGTDIIGVSPNDDRFSDIEPDPRAFKGKVYVICDGYTRDAGAAFVMLAKREGRAHIIGEEVGTNSYRFTGGNDLVMQATNSNVKFIVPLMLYEPTGVGTGPRDRGELPNTEIQQQPSQLAAGIDGIKESLLYFIRETQ